MGHGQPTQTVACIRHVLITLLCLGYAGTSPHDATSDGSTDTVRAHKLCAQLGLKTDFLLQGQQKLRQY